MAKLTEQEVKYIKLKALDRVYCGYDNVARAIGKPSEADKIRKEYSKKGGGGIKKWIADEIFGKNDEKRFDKLAEIANNKEVVDIVKKIDSIFSNQFSGNNDRKKGFQNNFKDFYQHLFGKFGNGFEPHKAKCHYCGTTQEELDKIFDEKNGFILSNKFGKTMQIERLDSKKVGNEKNYTPKNTVLACPLCNNSKSDMISAENFKQYFGDCSAEKDKLDMPKGAMRAFVEHLLSQCKS